MNRRSFLGSLLGAAVASVARWSPLAVAAPQAVTLDEWCDLPKIARIDAGQSFALSERVREMLLQIAESNERAVLLALQARNAVAHLRA